MCDKNNNKKLLLQKLVAFSTHLFHSFLVAKKLCGFYFVFEVRQKLWDEERKLKTIHFFGVFLAFTIHDIVKKFPNCIKLSPKSIETKNNLIFFCLRQWKITRNSSFNIFWFFFLFS